MSDDLLFFSFVSFVEEMDKEQLTSFTLHLCFTVELEQIIRFKKIWV